jgi:PKHD-type hydroxylase
MRGWWQMWEGLFSPQTCANWIAMAREIPPQQGVVGHGGATRADPMRRSTIRWIARTSKHNANGQWTPVLDRVLELFQEGNDNCFGFDIRHIASLQFTEYTAEQAGHYDWHEDLSWTAAVEFQRKLSMVIQLSDPTTYEGGNLELKEDQPDQTRLRRQGTVIIFPSFLEHRVTPVTAGVRHSLVTWINGPCFK